MLPELLAKIRALRRAGEMDEMTLRSAVDDVVDCAEKLASGETEHLAPPPREPEWQEVPDEEPEVKQTQA